jgi:hypothetical protein
MYRYILIALSSISLYSAEDTRRLQMVRAPSTQARTSNQEQAPVVLTSWQKTRKCLTNCCVSKLLKIGGAYFCCGKNCTETVKTFGEYKIVTALGPVVTNPYCWAATACCACTAGTCYLYGTNQLPCIPLTMPYPTL